MDLLKATEKVSKALEGLTKPQKLKVLRVVGEFVDEEPVASAAAPTAADASAAAAPS